jgi:Flp pilus assembly protein TadD
MTIRLRETCLFLAVACHCAAQTTPSLSREQLRSAWEKDWTKVSEVPFDLLEECDRLVGPALECNQPSPLEQHRAGLVSAAHLRHKVPKEAAKAFQHALTLSHAGEHGKAEEELERAIHLDPDFAEAHANLGIEYASTGSYQLAEVHFRRSIELDPASSTAYCNLAVLLIKVGRAPEAETSIRRALALAPENANAHFLLARLLLAVGDHRIDAEQHLKYASQSIPSARAMLKELREKPSPQP